MYLNHSEILMSIEQLAMIYMNLTPGEERGAYAEQVMTFTSKLDFKLARDTRIEEYEAEAVANISAALNNVAYIPEPYSHEEANVVFSNLITVFVPRIRN